MSGLSTHVLDVGQGHPAVGVPVALERSTDDGRSWVAIGHHETDADGRVGDLLSGESLRSGLYRLVFDLDRYLGPESFFPRACLEFRADDPTQHYHVPLLLSPYGYTTYRGS